MEINFKHKCILITGAGKGIGRILAIKLAKSGGDVIAVSRTKEDLDSLEKEVKLRTICVDLSDWYATQQAMKNIGPIDYLVNNAAIALLDSFVDVVPEDFDKSFATNVKAVLNISQIVAKDMISRKSGGSIVNISSQAAHAALADHAVYSATKGALESMSRVMALELGQHNIRVNTICPTVVMTDMGKIGWSKPEKSGPMLSKIPLRKFAEVEDVVNGIIFLISDKASMISGISLPIDGGFLAC